MSALDESDLSQAVPHPYGIKPLGNLMTAPAGTVNARDTGLGCLGGLGDEQAQALLHYLDAPTLAQLAVCSRGSYVWAHCIELWRALVLQTFGGRFTWAGSWKASFAASTLLAAGHPSQATLQRHTPIKVSNFYSDVLFQAHHVATLAISPSWLKGQDVPEEHADSMSVEEFKTKYEKPNLPVLISGLADKWPAFGKWGVSALAAAHPDADVTCGHFDVNFSTYASYCASINGEPGAQAAWDDQPLYLFDKHFAERLHGTAEDFSVPPYFQEDLFSVMGAARPHFRWLIAGPKASGSTFHVDPNGTSAWNAVLTGAKKWIMYPPSTPPPGVHPSATGAEVAAPLSLTEWCESFYAQHTEVKEKAWAGAVARGEDPLTCGKVPLEFIAPAGSVLFVPSGWWHMALNLENDTMALTQNFVSSANLGTVMHFLKYKPQQVSGVSEARCKELWREFQAALERARPLVWAKHTATLLSAKQAADAKAAKYRKSNASWCSTVAGVKRSRDEAGSDTQGDEHKASAAAGASNTAPVFSFGFSFSTDD